VVDEQARIATYVEASIIASITDSNDRLCFAGSVSCLFLAPSCIPVMMLYNDDVYIPAFPCGRDSQPCRTRCFHDLDL
jgi:hypothetical protein